MLSSLRGTGIVIGAALRDRGAPTLDPERLQARRDARARQMVRYASETVPHYRELFTREGIDPREIAGAQDLQRLPIIEKEELRADPERFRSTSADAADALAFESMGTSGVPVTIYHDRRSLLENIAYAERERAVVSRLAGKSVRAVYLHVATPTGMGRRTQAFYRAAAYLPVRPRRVRVSLYEPIDRLGEAIDRIRPDVVRGWGTHLELLFRALLERGYRGHLPRVVSYASEGMSPEGKLFFELELGLPVVSSYAAVESFRIAFTCEERRDFHVHDDLCHVRLVGPDGRDVPSGSEGEVVISNLINRGTVLLNYRLGDLASVAGPCLCGRTLPLLSGVRGRTSELVTLPDGTLIHPVAVWEVMRGRPGLVRYQLVQLGPARFTLKLVTSDRETYEHHAAGAAVDMSRFLRGATVEPEFVPLAEAGTVGKFTRVVALKPGGGYTPR